MVKGTRKRGLRKESSVHMLCPSLVALLAGTLVLLALAGQYKPPTRLLFWGLPSVITRHRKTIEQGSSLASCKACHSFTQAHHRVSKAQQKTCLLEQITRAPSILTLSWRILDKPPKWKIVVELCKDAGILGPWRRRIQSGARDEAWLFRAFV